MSKLGNKKIKRN